MTLVPLSEIHYRRRFHSEDGGSVWIRLPDTMDFPNKAIVQNEYSLVIRVVAPTLQVIPVDDKRAYLIFK